MDYITTYKDGSVYHSSNTKWRHLPRDKDIKSMGIYDGKGKYYELEDYDIWFFSDEGTSRAGAKDNFMWESRSIGGWKRNGNGKVVKCFILGTTLVEEVHLIRYAKDFGRNAFIFNEGV